MFHPRWTIPLIGMLFLATACWWTVPPVEAVPPGKTGWKNVDEALSKGLPKTAIEEIKKIETQSRENGNDAALVHAIAMRINLEAGIRGSKPAEKIMRMKQEIERASPQVKPLLQTILAKWYWNYFSQNRWRFANRTQVAAADQDDNDFTTWDLSRIINEIDTQFQLALGSADRLKKLKSNDYSDLLEAGNPEAAYRPTLYDVVAESAIEFYSAGEHGGTESTNAYELPVESAIFERLDAFLKFDPQPAGDHPADETSSDKDSPDLQAIRLLQQLLRFHQDDENQTAKLDWDLKRLRYGYNHAVGEGKLARYQEALQRFSTDHKDHFVSSIALHALAQTQHGENDWVKAHQTAKIGLDRFPDTVGGRRCANLIAQIEARELRVNADQVWSTSAEPLHLNYRNVTKVYFRVIARKIDDALINQLRRSEIDDLFGRPNDPEENLPIENPVVQWTETLQPTEDFQLADHTVDVSRTKDLPRGMYWLVSSTDPNFQKGDNQVNYLSFWRSELALVMRTHYQDGFVDGIVTDAKSGTPIGGASVDAYARDRNQRFAKRASVATTDANGMFRYVNKRNETARFLIRTDDDMIASASHFSVHNNRRTYPDHEQTIFFTDRAIYRPGQSLNYKGICYRFNHQSNKYEVIPNRTLTVMYRDANGQEIEKRTHRSNDFGSFSGSFNTPRDRVMGAMSIRVEGNAGGYAQVRVEEYKRPKFRVEVDSPMDAVKLGDEVLMTGKASAYTGAPIDGAKVAYRVVRNVRYAPWWYWRCWWMPVPSVPSKEIASGTVQTDEQGSFEIPFLAEPDRSVDKASEPTFTYTVYADVTDSAGETRSDQASVSLGYSAIKATLSADDFLTTDQPIKLNLNVSGLYGEDNVATGTIKIYRLKQPDEVSPPNRHPRSRSSRSPPQGADAANPNSWEQGELVQSVDVETTPSGSKSVELELPAGIYRAATEIADELGNQATAYAQLQVIDLEATKQNIKIPFLLRSAKWSAQPGETFKAVWGSGYDAARVFIEVEHRGKVISKRWTDAQRTQGIIEIPINEAMRGGVILRTTMIRNNRAEIQTRTVDVPWDNKKLNVTWERFVSKLQPAAKETWTAIVKSTDGKPVSNAEMVATLYDASLDAFVNHSMRDFSNVFYRNQSNVGVAFQNGQQHANTFSRFVSQDRQDGRLMYWRFPSGLFSGYGYPNFRGRGVQYSRMERRMVVDEFGVTQEKSYAVPQTESMMMMDSAGAAPAPASAPMEVANEASSNLSSEGGGIGGAPPEPAIDFGDVTIRKNLQETAFFLPSLVTREDGSVEMSFTMPEALTEWKFIGFTHDAKLRGGILRDKVVTAKDLMVQPNPPRFAREGDQLEFTVKVTNQSPTAQSGTARLTFADFRSGESVDGKLANSQTDKSFSVPAGQSKTLSWKIKIPDGLDFLTYKAVGSTGKLSDGEEGYLPVLSKRVLVQESLPLPIRGKKTKQFDFERLIQSEGSQSIQHQSLAVQVVSNPSWYAVMSLPYLMEYPHECSEQTFNRFYANSLARHIVTSDEKIERVFDAWRSTPALDSPLEKNEDLKSIAIMETPWKRDAVSESRARRDVGILFQQNRLDDEMKRAWAKLSQMQMANGSWPWFDGGRSNDYLTLYIATGMGRLRHLGVDVDQEVARKAFRYLDGWMRQRYEKIEAAKRSQSYLSNTIALYLYGRSFFLKEMPVADEHQVAFSFWKNQAAKHWLSMSSRQTQGHIALALHRSGETKVAKSIATSLKERSLDHEEMGMHWEDAGQSWWWYHAPVESQAMMIEVFDEVMNDQESVEGCKVWMIKQRQTNSWPTTKSTADAVYALLLRGSDLLASNELVRVSLGGEPVEPKNVEAGTGFYEKRFVKNEIKPSQGRVEMTKVDDGVAWGSLHWQYLEDIGKVTANRSGPLTLAKKLYLKKNTPQGPTLTPLDGPANVGDELVVRLILRTDRDMEYVHLKDHRGSGTEPTNVLSRYKSQDGLWYYESTRDTASHFFIDYLPKGDYVFEYATRIQLRGRYQTGFAHIECMYAPEFDSHSESLEIVVK